MKQIRRRLTFANVVACLALFVALGGASYAATQLPKNSVGSKQIKKNAVTAAKIKKNSVNSAKVKNRSLKAVDFKAGQLPTGKEGPQGAQGEPGGFAETLPSGKTERGSYSYAGTVPSGAEYVPAAPISYPFPLTFAPEIRVVEVAGASTSECPGSETEPQAKPGYLCIYEARVTGEELEPNVDIGEGQLGITLFLVANEGENWEFNGTWAVTAP